VCPRWGITVGRRAPSQLPSASITHEATVHSPWLMEAVGYSRTLCSFAHTVAWRVRGPGRANRLITSLISKTTARDQGIYRDKSRINPSVRYQSDSCGESGRSASAPLVGMDANTL
jgi:hypothetical protein